MKKGLRVLSLFDGISCGRVALERAGFEVEKYYASEIHEPSIEVALDNYPDIVELGDVTKLLDIDEDGEVCYISETLKNLPKIDILIGGSPCQGLSRSKPIRENLKDVRSKLFYNYVAIKEWLEENNNSELKFLLENVKPNKETKEIMDEKMGVEAIELNSSLVSAQDRVRLYWTNIRVDTEGLKEKSLTGEGLVIEDIMEENPDEEIKDLKDNPEYLKTVRKGRNGISWDTSGKGYYSQMNRARYKGSKMNTLTKKNSGDKTRIYLGDYTYRNASVLEVERLQTLPEGYTSILSSKAKRKGVIGDGWTVDIIVEIFKGLREEKKEEKAV